MDHQDIHLIVIDHQHIHLIVMDHQNVHLTVIEVAAVVHVPQKQRKRKIQQRVQ